MMIATSMDTDQQAAAGIAGTAANELADAMDADVLLFNGPTDPPMDEHLRAICHKRRHRTNVILVLVTWGGEADSAYRIAKCLQSRYKKFTLYVTGYCKSAGTLVAVGAHELVFGEYGELGPLDVQMSKKDTLWEMQSGLTVNASLTALKDQASLAFQDFFQRIEEEIPGSITVKTASEIATNLTVGLMAPLYSQVDPLHVGEAARAMQIADHYGRLLLRASHNLNLSALQRLISGYPSHSFVLDKQEASEVFKNVRGPNEAEAKLAAELDNIAVRPVPYDRPVIRYLSREKELPIAVEQSVPIAAIHEAPPEKTHDRGERPDSRTIVDRIAPDAGAGPAQGLTRE